MGRRRRLKYSDPRSGYYHIVTSIVQQEFLLDKEGKDEFLSILRKLSRVYFVKVVTFALMSNHVHLILRMVHSDEISDEELKIRHHTYYNTAKPKEFWRAFPTDGGQYFRKRLGDLSKFVQDLKQRFSRWCNKRNNKRGHVWGERFTSVMLEGGRALTACMIYVELNSVRAGIVKCPEDYRWCGLHHYVAGGRAAAWLDHETFTRKMAFWSELHDRERGTKSAIDESSDQQMKSYLKRYLELIYREGLVKRPGKTRMTDTLVESALEEDFASVGILSRNRMCSFSRGVFLGSKEFCEERFHEFRDYFKTTRERTGQPFLPKHSFQQGGLLDFYAMQKATQHRR